MLLTVRASRSDRFIVLRIQVHPIWSAIHQAAHQTSLHRAQPGDFARRQTAARSRMVLRVSTQVKWRGVIPRSVLDIPCHFSPIHGRLSHTGLQWLLRASVVQRPLAECRPVPATQHRTTGAISNSRRMRNMGRPVLPETHSFPLRQLGCMPSVGDSRL